MPIRSRPIPRPAITLFSCRKCRKKLKHHGAPPLKLKKLFKRAARLGNSTPVRHVDLPCLRLCPRAAITACTAGQLARSECSILRSRSDAQALYRLALSEAASAPARRSPLLN